MHCRCSSLAVVLLVVFCCIFASAQGKPGLWQTETTMTWEKAPIPPEMLKEMQNMPDSPFNRKTRIVTRTCVTQEIIDKFGAPEPQTQTGCMLLNVQKSATQTSADMVCQGQVSGKGDFVATRPDADHAVSHVHFAGSMSDIDAEWTMNATSTFQSSSCGTLGLGKTEVVH